MSPEQITNISYSKTMGRYKEVAEAQAEISFKAGEQAERERSSIALAESYFRGRQDGLVVLDANIEEAHKAGIREVVEWIEEHNWKRITTREEWQARLKDWEIE